MHTFADVPGVRVSVQCSSSNVVLSWPSQTGETFTVLHRPSLNVPSWVTLTNLLRASASTNLTTFVHLNATYCPEPEGGGGSGGGGPPAPGGSNMTASSDGLDVLTPWWERWMYEGRLPYLHEIEQRPPYPWDPDVWLMREQASSANDLVMQSSSLESGGSGPNTTIRFYRVFKTSPVATADFFSVQQDSGTNQLDIFDNDFDPDDDTFLLSNVTSAGDGSIEFTDDASIFRYIPNNGFSGSNSFTYTITNLTGGRATTRASIFVNESGNSPPVITSPIITLSTNVYAATINPTNGATDPNGDPIGFVAFTTPQLGTVSNSAGQLTYTHPTNLFGLDTFQYFLTDGRGGLTRVSVLILQADGENDGIVDQWELRFGFDPALDDSYADPDVDGLPNLAEYKLSTHPRISDNPLNLEKIITGQAVSNYARIPLSLNPSIQKPVLSLLMNGDPANAFLQQGGDGTWYFSWDTGYLTNGNYSIAANFQFNPDAQAPLSNSVVGQAKSVYVTNEVIFDQINSEFSHTWYINAAFPYQNADWRIELYDEDGSGLVYFEGTTADGNVQGAWDLTDTGQGGQQISFGNILAEIYVAPAISGQGSLPPVGARTPSARRWFAKQLPSGIRNSFVVAWGWDSYSANFNQARENLMLDGVINIIGNPAIEDEYTLRPGANIPYGGAFRFDSSQDETVLIDALKASDSGNFFWFGHGDAGTIQGNAKKASIQSGQVENELQNKKHRSKPPKLSRQNKHPYRLVILNGCETYSADWANAFGIDYSPSTSTRGQFDYITQGRQPQAYVGWTEGVEVPGLADFTLHNQYALGLADLFIGWMGGSGINSCLQQYAAQMESFNFRFHDSWRISGCYDLTRP